MTPLKSEGCKGTSLTKRVQTEKHNKYYHEGLNFPMSFPKRPVGSCASASSVKLSSMSRPVRLTAKGPQVRAMLRQQSLGTSFAPSYDILSHPVLLLHCILKRNMNKNPSCPRITGMQSDRTVIEETLLIERTQGRGPKPKPRGEAQSPPFGDQNTVRITGLPR